MTLKRFHVDNRNLFFSILNEKAKRQARYVPPEKEQTSKIYLMKCKNGVRCECEPEAHNTEQQCRQKCTERQ